LIIKNSFRKLGAFSSIFFFFLKKKNRPTPTLLSL
jgi:hypothetical protein